MDTLTHYIREGNKLSALKLFAIFFLLSVLIVGIVGFKLNGTLAQPDFQSFLTEIPVIEIQNNAVIKPENKIWEKKLADGQFLFQIDTTKDKIDNPPENGIRLTRQQVVFSLNGQIKEYQLPQEKVVIDTPFLKHLFQMTIINTCVLIGIILLFLFLLGQASTSVLSSFCLWIFKRQADKDQIRRSSFIGWLSVLALNIMLRVVGYGFSLIVCVFIATIISVFGLLWMNKNEISEMP